MARIDIWGEQYRRPEAEPVFRTLQAAGCPEMPLTLRRLGTLESGVAGDKAREYVETYLEADPPPPLIFPDGRRVPVSRIMLTNVATLQQMQVSAEGEQPYTLIEWLGIADRFPGLWAQVILFSNEVQSPKVEAGNALTPATGR